VVDFERASAGTLAVDANATILRAVSGTVRRTIDGGQTWSVFDAGLPGATPFFLTADPQLSGTSTPSSMERSTEDRRRCMDPPQ
jgi:hypothetical protein